jgi:hypothetical protein
MPRTDRNARSPLAACDRALLRCPVKTAIAAVPAFLDLRRGLKSSKILGYGTLLVLRMGPIQLGRRLAVIAAGIPLASTAKPSPLTRRAAMQAPTTRSKTRRRISLLRKRPSWFLAFSYNIELWHGVRNSNR